MHFLFIRPLVYPQNHIAELHQIFCASRSVAALRLGCDILCTSGFVDDVVFTQWAMWRVTCIQKRRQDSVTAETAATVYQPPIKLCSAIKNNKYLTWVAYPGQILVSTTPLFIGPILWGHSGPLCHALSLSLWTSILHCHSPGVASVARRLRYSYSWLRLILVVVSTVATPGEWQCKIRTGGVRRPAVASGPNIFQMLLVHTFTDNTTTTERDTSFGLVGQFIAAD